MTYFGVCQECSEAVRSDDTDVRKRRPAFAVTGFEVPREQGGTNHLRNRERVPNRVWHEFCLPDERAQPAEQGALL